MMKHNNFDFGDRAFGKHNDFDFDWDKKPHDFDWGVQHDGYGFFPGGCYPPDFEWCKYPYPYPDGGCWEYPWEYPYGCEYPYPYDPYPYEDPFTDMGGF
jgi:hypothetical protein